MNWLNMNGAFSILSYVICVILLFVPVVSAYAA
jgi:hypothetical protein